MATVPSTQLEVKRGALPKERLKNLREATRAHIESFDYMLDHGLDAAVADLEAVSFDVDGKRVTARIVACQLNTPTVSKNLGFTSLPSLWPTECRQRRVTYKGDFILSLEIDVEGNPGPWRMEQYAGQVPVMIMSNRCRLRGLTPQELVAHREEAQEMGGYFVINGNEKTIRMLLMPRRNHPISIVRPSYVNRGLGYTPFGVQMRCVRPDQSAQTVVVHYKSNGVCIVGFSYRKQQFLIPATLLLRALSNNSDREIFSDLVRDDLDNTFLVERVEILLEQYSEEQLFTQEACLAYLGALFKVLLNVHPSTTDVEAARILLKRVLFVHLPAHNYKAKYSTLVGMIRRVYSLASGNSMPDSADSQMMQELLMPGQIYCAFLKEQMQEYLNAMKKVVANELRLNRTVNITDVKYIKTKVLARLPDIGAKVEYFMSTGNLNSPTALDQMQVNGFTVVADKLNFLRYLSHFRCVHRGAYFAQMKTTAVRKLLPEGWGFMCPVHTPDGAPCGLLNHMSRHCYAPAQPADASQLPTLLFSLGMLPMESDPSRDLLDVLLDGLFIGHVTAEDARKMEHMLRVLKTEDDPRVPRTLEIGCVPVIRGGQYPGLYLFTGPARLMRPVYNLRTQREELIGSFEQVYMDIAVEPKEFVEGVTTHMELTKHGFLSVVASFTPFSDFNQSPRNMYQCQMGKQTMGVPVQSRYRADNKLYCLNSGQTPIVRTRAYHEYGVDNFPTGNNAIVCVISYTGYDMEDAFILNKSSMERGFMHARVVTTKVIDLTEKSKSGPCHLRFGLTPAEVNDKELRKVLDADGLPNLGVILKPGDPMYNYIDEEHGSSRRQVYRGEPATVERVTLLGGEVNSRGAKGAQKATITLAINRNPVIGDKFASRAGQKGILSQLMPSEDMPFTESGMVPDILFNPHGFPSRMTIGMMIESMAGKSGALHGIGHDATPFQFNEKDRAVDYFGEQLRKAGYNYYGHERMYSGVSGEEFEVDIFIGNVFYQRLRHMVSDKFQVRTQGPVNPLTRQPVKGRKKNGGVRFGEMERDALLGHGAAFLLHDRLVNCSDTSETDVCRSCGSLLAPLSTKKTSSNAIRQKKCQCCGKRGQVVTVNLPYVFRYLTAELSAMNIRLSLEVAPVTG